MLVVAQSSPVKVNCVCVLPGLMPASDCILRKQCESRSGELPHTGTTRQRVNFAMPGFTSSRRVLVNFRF